MNAPLAAGGEDPMVKVAVGVFIAIAWVVAQVYGALTKKKDQRLPPSNSPRPTRPPGRPTPPAKSSPPPRAAGRLKPPPLRRPPSVATMVTTAARPSPPTPRVSLAPAVSPAPSRPAAVLPRRETIDALLRPRNLKKTLIATELLRPPLALRDEAASGR